jgi:hypothetical protein
VQGYDLVIIREVESDVKLVVCGSVLHRKTSATGNKWNEGVDLGNNITSVSNTRLTLVTVRPIDSPRNCPKPEKPRTRKI